MSSLKVSHAHVIGTLLVQVVTLCIAALVIQYMHKLEAVPECKRIAPYTREGLLVYAYFLAFLSALSCLAILFFVLSK